MSDTEMEGNPDDLITASEVAKIWNRRAKSMGYEKHYTRRSVNVRRTYVGSDAKAFVPAQKTSLGNLYRRKDAWEFPIRPDLGRKVTEKHSDSKSLPEAA